MANFKKFLLQEIISNEFENIICDQLFQNVNEGRSHTISKKEMFRSIERLPETLRNKFPKIGYSVTQGQKKFLPFDLRKIWTIHPEILEESDDFIFGLHFGDPWKENLMPNKEEISTVVNFINSYMKNRGWYIQNWDQSSGTLKIEIMPEKTNRMTKMPEILFHLTDTKNISSILSTGLKPKASINRDRSYSARVYVFGDKNLLQEQIKQNIEAHRENASWLPKLTETLDMSVVEIDTTKLRKGTKFYRDPEFSGYEGAYYTYTHIPPEAIIKVWKV